MASRRVAPWAILVLGVARHNLLTPGGGEARQFGDPLPGPTPDLVTRFRNGKAASVAAEDVPGGRGSAFNDTAFANCHNQAAVGGGNDRLETGYGQLTNGVFNPLTQLDGTTVHAKGIGLFNGVDFVGEVVPPEPNVAAGRRVNLLFGLGLVEELPHQSLEDRTQFEQDFNPQQGVYQLSSSTRGGAARRRDPSLSIPPFPRSSSTWRVEPGRSREAGPSRSIRRFL